MTSLRERGAQAVADVWNADVPPKYHVDAALVEQNLLDHPLLHEEASLWWEETFVAIKRSAASLYSGPDPKVAHLSLFGADNGPTPADRVPSFPLMVAIEALREEGYEALVVGQDSGHFLPGLPTDVPYVSRLLKGLGFVRGGLAFDLERNLRDHRRGSLILRPGGHRCLEDRDMEGLRGFLEREFPGRWTYDVLRKVEVEGPNTVFGLFVDGSIEGFALLQNEACRLPIGGAVWRKDLGPRWASLGPIGVSRSLRGQSYGTELLNAALAELHERGAQRTIIDWTELVDFYGEEGFSVNRAYRSYRLNLREDPPRAR